MSGMQSGKHSGAGEWVITRAHGRTSCEIRAEMQKKKARRDKVNWRKEPSALFCDWGRGPSPAERSSTETLERVHACMVGRFQWRHLIEMSKRANFAPTARHRLRHKKERSKEREKERKKLGTCRPLKVAGPDRWTSYLQLRVVRRDVGVVVPAGRHTVEKHLLRSAVVVVEEPNRLVSCVLIIPRLPLTSQRLRESQEQQWQQQPAHTHLHGCARTPETEGLQCGLGC